MAEVLVRPVLARESARSRLERASFGLAFGLAGTLAALLLVAPTVIVLVTSFTNAYSLRFPPPGYSTRWYEALWNDSPEILEAAQRSLEVAGIATALSTVLAVAAALALVRRRELWARVLESVFLSPLMLPTLALGLSLAMAPTLAAQDLPGTTPGLVMATAAQAATAAGPSMSLMVPRMAIVRRSSAYSTVAGVIGGATLPRLTACQIPGSCYTVRVSCNDQVAKGLLVILRHARLRNLTLASFAVLLAASAGSSVSAEPRRESSRASVSTIRQTQKAARGVDRDDCRFQHVDRLHGGGEGRFAIAEEGFEQREQIVDRRTQRSGAGQNRKVPERSRFEAQVVAGGHALLLCGRECDDGVGEAQRFRDAGADQRFVIGSRAEREDVAEQARAQVRVFDFGSRIAREGARGQELIEIIGTIAGVGIGGILRAEIAGQARQAGGVRRKMQQRDGLAVALRHADVFGKIAGGGIVQGDFVALDHVSQQQGREDLGEGSDFEQRVATHRARVALRERAVGVGVAALRIHDAGHHAGGLFFLIDAID